MRVNIDLQGMEKALADLRMTAERAEQATVDTVTDVALMAHRQAVRGIQRGGKSGRTYQKYNPRRTHKASAPGQYPASDTGRLAASVAVELPTSEERPVARVGTALRYGAYLELKPSAMGGRPWLTRAIREAAIQLRNSLAKKMK